MCVELIKHVCYVYINTCGARDRMTWLSIVTEGHSLDFLFFRVPYSLSPFASLVLTQVIRV